MFAALSIPRRVVAAVAVAASLAMLSACQPVVTGDGGPSINTGRPIPVALLVPGGSGSQGDTVIAQSLENAARLAISDLDGVKIDLRVYNTAGNAQGGSVAAANAISDGAKIIIGPLYAQAANAAGLAAAARNINVLAFSNNTNIAGGNVFVLGNTFENTANRLVRYAARTGKGRIFVVHAQTEAETIGRNAITRAISNSGASLAGTGSFELSQQGLINAIPGITSQIRSSGANAVFFTSDNEGAMPFLAQLLPENGISVTETQFIGLTRLDIPAAAVSQPGLQGAIYATPDPGLNANFRSRYNAAYGFNPHPLAGLAYDGIAAIGALAKQGNSDALTRAALTTGSGFVGTSGVFRLRADGTNQRGLAVAKIQNNQVTIIDPAPRSFGGAGF